MIRSLTVRSLTGQERDQTSELLAEALAEDPFVAWLTGGGTPPRRLAYARLMFDLTVPYQASSGVFRDEELISCALWVNDADWVLSLGAQMTMLPRMMRVVGVSRFFGVSDTLDVIAKARPPGPWKLLSLIATKSTQKRQGHASSLMQNVLTQADEEGMTLVLETSVSENVEWYSSFGFEVYRRVQIGPQASLRMMSREAQRGRNPAAVKPRDGKA